MVRFLTTRGSVRFNYLGKLLGEDLQQLREVDFEVDVRELGFSRRVTGMLNIENYREILSSGSPASLYIVNKTENSFILDALPKAAAVWVDTHDLVSARTLKAAASPVPENFPLTVAEEKELLRKYDLAICIQRNEYQTVCDWLGQERVAHVPHAVQVTPRTLQNPPCRIGLVASGWHANAYGLRDFIQAVWPDVRRTRATLDVYGPISEVIRAKLPAVTFHGYQEDLDRCYGNMDIAINPVTYGAGLKIKSVEALANGLPLVTTREGASGLEELDGEALFIADDWEHFSRLLIELVQDHTRCVNAGRKGADYARKHLSREACFAPLEKSLQKLERASPEYFV